ncbi:hypothetical protein C1646_764281 [Rhizophagus diaphanus]|nr:hypothetical protein C1646_764281 [Rhizophagus diaphanus] [Rhizophagus sp. MUCL 43196]
MSSDISNKENIENTFQIEEEFTYPSNNNIIYRKRVNNVTKHSFNYIILKEGIYPNEITNKKQINNDNTKKKRLMRHYKIPNNYVVETTWASNYEKALRPETKSTISGPLLFGLQLESGIYHQTDQVVLRNIELFVNETNHFQVNFGSENEVDKTHHLRSVVKAVDQGQISRDSY